MNNFQLQIQWMSEGNWEPTVYAPSSFDVAVKRYEDYTKTFIEHNYRIVNLTTWMVCNPEVSV